MKPGPQSSLGPLGGPRTSAWPVVLALLAIVSPVPADEPTATSAADPVERIRQLRFERGPEAPDGILLHGADDRHQLVVTGILDHGDPRDVTRLVHYDIAPLGIVSIDSTGMITPRGDGTAVIHARAGNRISARIRVTVDHGGDMLPVDFQNEIVPIFTKRGCNAGGCHGKSGGQNGFALSLLGFEPDDDYEHLVFQARGRRLFPASPDSSLLLQKATGRLPHGGGDLMAPDSTSYRLLAQWIAQGMPPADPHAPTVTRIEITPSDRVMQRQGKQQVRVVACYSDTERKDVTRRAQFDTNNHELADVSETGLVATKDQPGSVAVMARYQGQVAVFRATVPLGAPVDSPVEPRNFVDQLVFKQLTTLGLPPSPVCDETTFARRSCLDIAGRLPTVSEVERFLADSDPDRRDKWIDQRLDSADYADYFANKWSMVLRNRRQNDDQRRGSYAFHAWVRDRLYANTPYDQFVREIVAAAGEVGDNPAVVWYREVDRQEEQVEDLAQLFLGMRIKCARCHHHPFEVWSQDDYFGLAAFFSRIGRKPGRQRGEVRIYHRRGVAAATNPKTRKRVRPRGLGETTLDIPRDHDPRQALVDWMVAPDNPFFSRALVNRYWKHFFGRGLVEPEDDMRVTNPASNPELLDALAEFFTESGYDLKQLVRSICRSRVYQLSAQPNQYNAGDRQNFSRFYPRRLPAEVLLDAVNDLTGTPAAFESLPAKVRAVQLPDGSFKNYFLTVFGRPEASTACECERSGDGNLAQSLHLINSPDVQNRLASDSGRAAQWAADPSGSPESKLRELYRLAYSRRPNAQETQVALAYLEQKNHDRTAYEDLVWALINTKEFLFNH